MTEDISRLFVVGVGRSGTSLLQSMLMGHSQIAMMPETSFVRRFLVNNPSVSVSQINEDKYVERWINDGVYQGQKDGDAASIYRDVSKQYALKKTDVKASGTVKYVADKDPKMIEVLPHLDKVFNDYKIIHIVRDPRDVLLSKNKAEWSKGQSLVKKLVANKAQLQILEHYRAHHQNSVLELKYEDLLANPEQQLARICEFLQLDFEKDMLAFQQNAKNLVSKDEMSWKKETTGPLLTNNRDKWKQEMAPEVIDLTQSCCDLAMNKGSYEYPPQNIGFGAKLSNGLTRVVVALLSKVYKFKAINMVKS